MPRYFVTSPCCSTWSWGCTGGIVTVELEKVAFASVQFGTRNPAIVVNQSKLHVETLDVSGEECSIVGKESPRGRQAWGDGNAQLGMLEDLRHERREGKEEELS